MRSLRLVWLILASAAGVLAQQAGWRTVDAEGSPFARHECAFVAAAGKLYLIGGRGEKPVEVYDPATNRWTRAARPPLEIHHFQPVVLDGRIYIVGALTGKYPHETPVENVLTYDPAADRWETGPAVPLGRRRGAAGVAVRDGKIYVVAGIQDGHWDGHVSWFDEFDPKTGEWRRLPDAPRPRDHFQAVVLGNKLYAAAGRRSSAKTKATFTLTIGEVDVYDFGKGEWSTLPHRLPTQRAGNMAVGYDSRLIVLGGESSAQRSAHAETEVWNPRNGGWETAPALIRGRHGTGASVVDAKLYVAAGSGDRGGGPELTSLEVLDLGAILR